MPHPCPHHCPPERGGRGLAVLAALALVVIGAAAARPVVHAAETVLEVAAITLGIVAGMAAAGAVTWLAVAARRRQAQARPLPAGQARAIAARTARELPPGQARAIEPPRPVYGSQIRTPDQTAAADRRAREP
jgi:hypothetical protein